MEPIVKRPVGRPRKTPQVVAPVKPKGDGLRRAAFKAKMLAADVKPYAFPVKPPELMPGVVPAGVTAPVMAADSNPYQFAAASFPGGGFPGFSYLSQLATRAEFRQMASGMATEITREWLEFTSKQDDDSDNAEKIKAIEDEFKRLNVRGVIQKAAEQDCYFGRAQIFLEIAGADRSPPLILDPRTIKKGSLARVVPVEAVWTTPAGYNALDPAAPDFYKPSSWFMLGQEVHASRLLTVVTRPLPDILKPAFNFAGMSLSQLAEPYVDNWLRTRQSVSDLLNNFSITALATSMDQVLQGEDDGADLMARAELFTATRSNKGLMLLDKDREELVQINTPLSGLHELQAQSQEQMCSVSRMPAIILTGISPSGLNASSDGEIRIFYDWIAAQQEAYWREPLEVILKAVQLSLFGEIDPDIGFTFVPLYQMTPKEEAEIRASDSQADCAYIAAGVVDPSEVRERLAKDPNSGFMGLDTSVELVPPEPQAALGESDPEVAAAMDAEFKESDHPRAANGQFGSGGSSSAVNVTKGSFAEMPTSVQDDIVTAILTRDAYAKDTPYMDAWENSGRDLDDFNEDGIKAAISEKIGSLKIEATDPDTIDNQGRAVSQQFVDRYKKQLDKSEAPPILIAKKQDGSFKVVEGGHRLAAAKAAGTPAIKTVDVTDLLATDPNKLFAK